MKEKKMTRRDAMARLTKIIAMAAGLSTTQVRRLFGAEQTTTKQPKPAQKATPVQKATPIKRPPNIKRIENLKTPNEKVKILKVLLHNNRSVFESEFGRVTPKYTVRDTKRKPERYRDFIRGFEVNPGMMICEVEWVGPGEMAQCDVGLVCGTNFFGGMGAVSGSCANNECNMCNFGCGGEAKLICQQQVCPGVNCGPRNYTKGITEFTTEGFFNRYRTEPYVQALLQEFQVNTTQALAQEIQSMLDVHR